MPRLELSQTGGTPHERLLGHNHDVLNKWLALETVFFSSPTFGPVLLEQVRRALAFGNQCEYCMAKAGPPDASAATARIGLATAFADIVGRNHREINEGHLSVLREEFTEREIAELTAFVCFISASQMFGAILGLSANELPPRPDRLGP